MKGDEVIQRIKQQYPDLPVVIISEQQDINTAVHLLKLGAHDYLVKDEDIGDRLWNITRNVTELQALRTEVETLRKVVRNRFVPGHAMIGDSAPMQKLYELIEKANRSTINVSITGETGTGKEVVAKAIHYGSARSSQPFVAVNIAAVPKELIESELFGHEKGSFTGALNRRIGKFEEAQGGTLFLDEIGEMELGLQAKLLRVLQERELYRVGGTQRIPLDVRIVVATHRNLMDEVAAGRFREDLYYRLLGLQLHVPALRQRDNDVVLLARCFLKTTCEEQQLAPKDFSAEAILKLKHYDYPGNVRELKSVVELAALLSDDDGVVEACHVQFNQQRKPSATLQQPVTLREIERQAIQQCLLEYDYDILAAARRLDIGKSTIYRMIKAGELQVR
jgi:DNA-binding NtrC family response regulator